MTEEQGDLMLGILKTAMAKCSDCFNPNFELFRRDIGGLFAGIVQRHLLKLAMAHKGDDGFPIKRMTDVLSNCTWEFEGKIDSVVYKALEAAEKSFKEDMRTILGSLSVLIENELKEK